MVALLHDLVTSAARRTPTATAVRGPDGTFSYRELDEWSNRVARELQRRGVVRGDRVGLWAEKSCLLVAAMQACARIGAAYVPVAPGVPAARARQILDDCAVRAVVVDAGRLAGAGDGAMHACMCLDERERLASQSASALQEADVTEDDLAYILYTSGSTGQPKGVCMSHRTAMAFVRWAAALTRLDGHSRLANLAAFSFDLSVFDLYAAFMSGGSVSLVPEALSCSPVQLVAFLAREGITVWDSVPSALILMIEQGRLLERSDLSLATIIFGGEVFPIDQLRGLRDAWPKVQLLNFYGPTETNVCTWFEVGRIEPGRTVPVPIGRAACGNRVWLGDADGRPLAGNEGELFVEGPTVMLGYWGRERLRHPRYATGDICRLNEDGQFVFVGRRDQMVKIRGHRVELGEIEAVLRTHAGVADVAVVAIGEGVEARLVALIVPAASPAPTLVRLKEHCAARLPSHMVIGLTWLVDAIPRTPNGKVDRMRLTEIADAAHGASRAAAIGAPTRPPRDAQTSGGDSSLA